MRPVYSAIKTGHNPEYTEVFYPTSKERIPCCWKSHDKSQVITDYIEGVNWLKSKWFRLYGAVIDGMKGLAKALYPLPIQLCQFHKMLTVRKYITQDPDIVRNRCVGRRGWWEAGPHSGWAFTAQ